MFFGLFHFVSEIETLKVGQNSKTISSNQKLVSSYFKFEFHSSKVKNLTTPNYLKLKIYYINEHETEEIGKKFI